MRIVSSLFAAAILAAVLAAPAVRAQSLGPAVAPASPKGQRLEAFRLDATAQALRIRLEAPDSEAIEAVKRENARPGAKRLDIGLGREVDAGGAMPRWHAVRDGRAARWEVTSEGALALRVALATTRMDAGVELRFSGSALPGLVYGPFDAEAMRLAGRWSPVLEGETATIEVFVPGKRAEPVLAVEQLSHLFVSPADPKADAAAKASLPCTVNFICRASTDAALAETGRAVAKMTFTFGSGGTAMCTGTLLNSSSGSLAPYFHSAAHCFTTQALASTLTTHWFYETATCTGTTVGPSYVQVAGGARLLYANEDSDVLFLRLNRSAPSGAVYAGWDAARLAGGAAVTGIHHPQGDFKKVSLGAIAGFDRSAIGDGIATRVQWNSIATGFTEPGSSGSGIFTGSATAGYRFRGGLQGGPLPDCTSPVAELFDTYSRFDLAYPFIAQYLSPGAGPALGVNVVANPGFEGGSTSWTQSSAASTPIITNDPGTARTGSWYAWLGGAADLVDTLTQPLAIPAGAARLQFWYRIDTSETSVGDFDVMTIALVDAVSGQTLENLARLTNRDATPVWEQSAVLDVSAYGGRSVALRLRATNDLSLPSSFRVDDVTLNGTPVSASSNATALWWNHLESGWGLNVNEQGNTTFATLFTYESSGAPMWLVMSAGARKSGAASFVGELYRTTGPPFNANPFPPIGPGNISRIGDMTLDFSGGVPMLGYTVNDTYVAKAIEKQVYGAAAANCQPVTGSRAGATNYQDLWWNMAESGWGLNVTHQGNTIFATLFTYAAGAAGSTGNQGLWLVLPSGARQSDGSYSGELYRTNGPPFNAQPWVPIGSAPVGTMRLRFQNGEAGTLEYSVNGTSVTKAITRQVFGSPVPLCTG